MSRGRFLVLILNLLIIFTPIYIYGSKQSKKTLTFQIQTQDSLLLIKYSKTENLLGEKFYSKWRKLKVQAYLDSAQIHFINAFNFLPESLKHQYSLEKGRLYLKNMENGVLMKDWYLNAIYYFKVSSPLYVELVLKKYETVEEFVKAYGRIYKNCDDALEILQDNKGDLDYYFIQKNPTEKKYSQLMDRLHEEERFLIFECNKKTK